MVRGKRQYSSALNVLSDTSDVKNDVQEQPKPVKKEVEVTEKPKQETKTEDVKAEHKQDKKQTKVNNKRNNKTSKEDVNIESKHNTETQSLDDLSKTISSMFEEKSKKKTMEETHTRATFLVENELLREFNELTEGKRGYKTLLINQVLRAVVDAHVKK